MSTAGTAKREWDPWAPFARDCPTWCSDQHALSREEGNDEKSSAIHWGPELVRVLEELRVQVPGAKNDLVTRRGGGKWIVQLVCDPYGVFTPDVVRPVISLSLVERGGDARTEADLSLTSGEARTLAAQLIHLADLDDTSLDQ